ncbi:hypothetical protein Cgig2_004146 [Carnegiea gigantea]|uniref:Sugar phosphate transporter domain-containing protein n=1 Tax=Carnegiea gigantea TaxID=171969 RepID=A0A9Q1KUJ3_9CARY|nr:hypothetical protein Cgig2_004146 [Carnegiea gigantea]
MQSSAISISISPSTPLLKSRQNPNPNRSFPTLKIVDPVHGSSSRRLAIVNSNSSFHSTRQLELVSSFDGFISKSAPIFGHKCGDDSVAVRATAVPESAGAGEAPKSSPIGRTLELGILFAMWYLFNIYFNIYNKQVLKVYPYPWTISMVQFAIGSMIVLFMWTFNLYMRPKVTAAQLAVITPLAILHTLGNLFTNVSLGKVAVSFTHTIKAMEPFFSVLLSILFLGEESLDNINLFSIITIMSFILLAPATIFMEGVKFTPAYLEAAGLNTQQVLTWSLLAALCFHAYQQLSYMILQRVSPVTHSVSNCVKRVVVIISSVIFFRTQVSPINALGTSIALVGVFLYSRVKRIKPKPKTP